MPVRKITREEYRAMLEAGTTFTNWTLYMPTAQPRRMFYIILDGKGNAILNKVPTQGGSTNPNQWTHTC